MMFDKPVWSLNVDSKIARKEAERRFRDKKSTLTEAVAHSDLFDNFTRERLADILSASLPDFNGKSFFRIF